MENEKLNNLFTAARNARETSDDETALKIYEEISTIDPNNWEAFFYLVVLKTNSIKYGEISNAAISVINCLPKVFELINTTIKDEQEKKNVVKEVVSQCSKTASWLITANGNFYNSITNNNLNFSVTTAAVNMDAKRKARYESAQRMANIGNILCACGNCIETVIGLEDEFYQKLAVDCWEAMLCTHFGHIKTYKVAVFNDEAINKFAAKVKQYKPSYELPDIKPTEKRNYNIAAILLTIAALGVGILIALPFLK